MENVSVAEHDPSAGRRPSDGLGAKESRGQAAALDLVDPALSSNLDALADASAAGRRSTAKGSAFMASPLSSTTGSPAASRESPSKQQLKVFNLELCTRRGKH